MPFRLVWCAALVVFFLCGLSFAQSEESTSENAAAARALFDAGRALVAEGRYEEACPKFEESLRLDHGIGTQFNLADCWENLGKVASALNLYLEVANAAQTAGQLEREMVARAKAKSLEPKLSYLRIDLEAPDSEVRVSLDGNPVDPNHLGKFVALDPGVYEVRAQGPGGERWAESVRVAGAGSFLRVRVPELDDSTPEHTASASGSDSRPPPVAELELEDASATLSTREWFAVGLGGAGLGGLTLGTVFTVRYFEQLDRAESVCANPAASGGCSRDQVEEYNRRADTADDDFGKAAISFGVGGAALATAAILYWAFPESPTSNETAQVTFVPMSGGVMTMWSSRW